MYRNAKRVIFSFIFIIIFIPFLMGSASINCSSSTAFPETETLSSEYNMSGGSSVYSAAFWMKRNSCANTTGGGVFAHTEDNTGFNDGWAVTWKNSCTQISIFTVGANSGDFDLDYDTGEWHFYYALFDQANDILRLIQDDTTIINNTSYTNESTTTTPELIFCTEREDSEISDADINLAYFQYFDRALTDAEIQQTRRCPGSIQSIGHWMFNDGTNGKDYSGLNNDLDASSAASSADGPPVSFCAGNQ